MSVQPIGKLEIPKSRPISAYLKSTNKVYTLYRGQNNVGRNSSCLVNIKNLNVSHTQAIITIVDDETHYLSDLKSCNGTFLNGKKLCPYALNKLGNGDSIKFGDVICSYKIADANQNNRVQSLDDSIIETASQDYTQAFYGANTQAISFNTPKARSLDTNGFASTSNRSRVDFHELATQCATPFAFNDLPTQAFDLGEQSVSRDEKEDQETKQDTPLASSTLITDDERTQENVPPSLDHDYLQGDRSENKSPAPLLETTSSDPQQTPDTPSKRPKQPYGSLSDSDDSVDFFDVQKQLEEKGIISQAVTRKTSTQSSHDSRVIKPPVRSAFRNVLRDSEDEEPNLSSNEPSTSAPEENKESERLAAIKPITGGEFRNVSADLAEVERDHDLNKPSTSALQQSDVSETITEGAFRNALDDSEDEERVHSSNKSSTEGLEESGVIEPVTGGAFKNASKESSPSVSDENKESEESGVIKPVTGGAFRNVLRDSDDEEGGLPAGPTSKSVENKESGVITNTRDSSNAARSVIRNFLSDSEQSSGDDGIDLNPSVSPTKSLSTVTDQSKSRYVFSDDDDTDIEEQALDDSDIIAGTQPTKSSDVFEDSLLSKRDNKKSQDEESNQVYMAATQQERDVSLCDGTDVERQVQSICQSPLQDGAEEEASRLDESVIESTQQLLSIFTSQPGESSSGPPQGSDDDIYLKQTQQLSTASQRESRFLVPPVPKARDDIYDLQTQVMPDELLGGSNPTSDVEERLESIFSSQCAATQQLIDTLEDDSFDNKSRRDETPPKVYRNKNVLSLKKSVSPVVEKIDFPSLKKSMSPVKIDSQVDTQPDFKGFDDNSTLGSVTNPAPVTVTCPAPGTVTSSVTGIKASDKKPESVMRNWVLRTANLSTKFTDFDTSTPSKGGITTVSEPSSSVESDAKQELSKNPVKRLGLGLKKEPVSKSPLPVTERAGKFGHKEPSESSEDLAPQIHDEISVAEPSTSSTNETVTKRSNGFKGKKILSESSVPGLAPKIPVPEPALQNLGPVTKRSSGRKKTVSKSFEDSPEIFDKISVPEPSTSSTDETVTKRSSRLKGKKPISESSEDSAPVIALKNRNKISVPEPAASVAKRFGRKKPESESSVDSVPSVAPGHNITVPEPSVTKITGRFTRNKERVSESSIDSIPIAPATSDKVTVTTGRTSRSSVKKESSEESQPRTTTNKRKLYQSPSLQNLQKTFARTRKQNPVEYQSSDSGDETPLVEANKSRRLTTKKGTSNLLHGDHQSITVSVSKTPSVSRRRSEVAPTCVQRATRKLSANSRNVLKNGEGSPPKRRRTALQSVEEVSTPTERSRRQLKPKVVFTMLDDPGMESSIRQLGGSVVDSVDDCTVLVTVSVKRTLKLLQAVGQGKPICGPDWILESRKRSNFLDPWDYILTDEESENKWKFSLIESLDRAKKSRLLEGYTFQLFVTNGADVLKGAISACGGKVVTRSLANCAGKLFIVASEGSASRYSKIVKQNPAIRAIEPEAIFDGALRQEVKFENHLVM